MMDHFFLYFVTYGCMLVFNRACFVYLCVNLKWPGLLKCLFRMGFMVTSQIIQGYHWAMQVYTTFSVGGGTHST